MKKISIVPAGSEENKVEQEFIEEEYEPQICFTCEVCGEQVKDCGDTDYNSIKCPKCSHINNVEIIGIGNISEEHIAKEYNKYSYCSCCEQLTLNIKGSTYGTRPFEETTYLLDADKDFNPLYNETWSAYKAGAITIGEAVDKSRDIEAVVPTIDQLVEKFFCCECCGKEKFWNSGYTCPKCDCEEYYFIEQSHPNYSHVKAMEFGGNPLDWDETWKCKCCGEIYDVANSNC